MRRLGLLLGAWVGVQVLLGVLSSLLQWLGLVAAAETAWGLGLGVGLLPLVGLVVVLVRGLCWLGWLLRLEPGARRQVWWLRRLRRGWPELAQSLGLVVRSGRDGRVLWPGMRAWPDAWGAVLELGTPPGVGRRELAARAQHLADQWGCVRVAVEQAAPGRLRLRALRWDPLLTPTRRSLTLVPPAELGWWELGRDEWGQPVRLRLAEVPGVVVAGLPGSGKTSLLNGLVGDLAPSPAVQVCVLDGKGGTEWEEVAPRCWALVGDELEAADELLGRLEELRRARAVAIRSVLGVRDLWQVGPSPGWPLVLVVVDEAHTYLAERRDDRQAMELVLGCRRRLEGLVKLGRSVGICTVLATQKATGDAIPTSIRDVCPLALSFAQRSREAAAAVLGPEIAEYPEQSPVELQGPQWVGVAVLAAPGRPGYVRVRVPWVEPAELAAVGAATAGLRRDPTELLGQAAPLGLVPREGAGALPPARGGDHRAGAASRVPSGARARSGHALVRG
ncbi:MAG TPA: FtsK/SpoIIIE domain-containing protein [Candidatus Dormibacteraeota bacterium]|nr:FtsK/SpoIIIE domain-containing protein [Candidatus Dormibacteraeota bacterium]